MVALTDTCKIWAVICVFLNPQSRRMEYAMEMAYVTHIMVKHLTTALQIADVETTFVNINLERHLTIVHQIVKYVEMANAMHLRVVLPASKTVEHV